MFLEETKDEESIKHVMCNTMIFKLANDQDIEPHEYKVDWSSKYLLLQDYERIYGLFRIREFSKITLEAHIYILPEYWGKPVGVKAVKKLEKYARSRGYRNIFTTVPITCVQVLQFLQKVNCKVCGKIDKGIIFNNELVDVILFNKNICGV